MDTVTVNPDTETHVPPEGSGVPPVQEPDEEIEAPPAIVKLSFNVAQHQVETLKRLSKSRGVSMTEILRHAIALEEFVQEQAKAGNRIVVENQKGGNRRELVLIGP